MTNKTKGKATLRHHQYDAEGWNADIAKKRDEIIAEHGEGLVTFRIEHDNSRTVHWTHRPTVRSAIGAALDAEAAAQAEQ